MKKFCFYLPQFHEIEENNIWWGDGFTEWTNVKNGKPLFFRHKQPKVPLNDNYYDLLDKDVVKWQTDLIHEYNIDGFIYYHYYFENGKLLLEKPVANLLKNKDIDQNFFFCWANHTWYRSWEGSKEVLIEQKYGNKDEWERHFKYLLPYFKDERYEKHNNMPLFMVFNSEIPNKNEMFEYLNKRSIEEGFNGIYFIEGFLDGKYTWPNDLNNAINNMSLYSKKLFLREPNTALDIYNTKLIYKFNKIFKKIYKTINHIIGNEMPSFYSGNVLYKLINSEPINSKLIHGLFFEWDNTPRHSKRGYIITPPKKSKFLKLMKKYVNEEYVFINAWNEWAEGMMLEPTKENGYKYLEWISEIDNKSV